MVVINKDHFVDCRMDGPDSRGVVLKIIN